MRKKLSGLSFFPAGAFCVPRLRASRRVRIYIEMNSALEPALSFFPVLPSQRQLSGVHVSFNLISILKFYSTSAASRCINANVLHFRLPNVRHIESQAFSSL